MKSHRFQQTVIWTALCLGAMIVGCGRDEKHQLPKSAANRTPVASSGVGEIELPKVDLKPGVAVVVLVDTSGSMAQSVRDRAGQSRSKHEIAREALERVIQQTEEWKKKKPEQKLQMAIANFGSSVHELMPMGEFDAAKARAALANMPAPNSGTAIGSALVKGFQDLYRSGCARKYVVCITDGENTAGRPPDKISRQLFQQTSGEVEIHFVAFDLSAKHFRFLKEVNGHVVEAADGKQLQDELTKIYDKRILAEKPE